jgi:sigma-B regulation protein RsbU (phosphoserine phosphatase)
MLYGKMGDNFITACMCSVNLETGEVVSANAGHPPMLIARNDGTIEVVNSNGKIIVDYAGSDYEERVSKLEKGDRILLYTDGVIEVRNNTWEFGENRFHKIIRDNIHLSADDMCKMIYEGIALKEGVLSIDDDFAVLVAEYRGA